MNAFEQTAKWITRETERLIRLPRTVAIRRKISELHARSVQLNREYTRWMEANVA